MTGAKPGSKTSSKTNHVQQNNEDCDHDAAIVFRMFNRIETKNEHISAAETDKSVDPLNVASESDGWFMNRCIYTTNFSNNEIENHTFNIIEMTRIEKEVFIMGTPQTGC